MSRAAVDFTFRIDVGPIVRAFEQAAEAAAKLADALFVVRYHREKAIEQRVYEYGQMAQILAPDASWDVQVVTTNEGRCRVVVRQLGGWS